MSLKRLVSLNTVSLDTDPSNPRIGDLYLNSVTNKVRVFTNTGWIEVGAGSAGSAVSIGTTPPATATEGDLWYNNVDPHFYTYDGTYWVEISFGPVGPVGPGVAAGGTTGQIAAKVSNTDYDTTWINPYTSTTFTSDLLATGIASTLATKSPTNSPTFTGTPNAPTATASTNNTQIATTAFVKTAVENLINGAPGTLDTFKELADALANDASYASTITTALSTKAATADIAELAQDAIGNNLGAGLSYNDTTGTIGVNPGAMLNQIVDGTSGNSYGLVGTSQYLNVKDNNGYNKEIELNIASVESKLVTDGFAKLASPTFTGAPLAPTATANANNTQLATTAYADRAATNAAALIIASAPAALDTLNELAAALGNDASFSTTITNALAAKAPLASPTFTGTVSGITRTMVGLGNVDNTSDSAKPISTATQTALNTKLALSGGTLTGLLTLSGSPTLDLHASTKLYVDSAITSLSNTSTNTYVLQSDVGNADGIATLDSTGKIPISQLGNIIDGAPAVLDTLKELSAAIGNDANFITTMTNSVYDTEIGIIMGAY